MPRQAAVLIGCSRTAVDFDRLIAVGDCAVEFAFTKQRSAAVGKAGRGIRIEANHFAEVNDRRIELPLAMPRQASIAVGDDIVGIALYRLAEILNCIIELPLAVPGCAPIGVDRRQAANAPSLINHSRASGYPLVRVAS